MTRDQELGELRDEWPGWRIWRDGHGQPDCWHATLEAGGRSVFVAADSPAEMRQWLQQVAARFDGARQ